MRNIQVISINHQMLNSEERIALNLKNEGWKQLFAYLTYNLGVDGYVLLQTCNRIELYYESEIELREEIIGKWLSLLDEKLNLNKGSFQTFSGSQECIEHFLQLSAGFKSAIYGDDQILSQLKKAFEEARQNKSMSTLLERAYQAIMRFHKQICRKTDFKSQTVSLAYQALKSARHRFGSEKLKGKKVLIIGAGDMAAQVVKYLPKFNFGNVSITNRTKSKADTLVANTSLIVVPYEAVDIQQYDLIISCTDQGSCLIDDWTSIEYYIDLSLHSSKLSNISVSHILLSQLQEIINVQNAERMKSVDKVHLILSDKANDYVNWCHEWRNRATSVKRNSSNNSFS